MLKKLNPFSRLPNPKEVWAWGMYDLANQSFQLLINTLLFGVYVTEVVAPDRTTGTQWWNGMSAVALLFVVVASPIAGAVADARAWKREILLGTGALCAVLMCSLALVAPGNLWLACVLYVPAAFLCGVGENFLGAFLPQVATRDTMGRVSAIGWTMSYVGALILQICMVAAVLGLGMKDTASWRPLFVFAGVWFALGMLPAFFLLHERSVRQATRGGGTLLGVAFHRLGDTLRDVRGYGQLLRFLGVFFVFSWGTQTVVYLSGVLMKRLGFNNTDLFIVALQLSVLAGVGAAFTGKFQDRAGHRRTVMFFLGVWVLTAVVLGLISLGTPNKLVFFLVCSGVGLGLGGIGTASRALVGSFTPEHKSAEFFGLWGMVYKLAGVVALTANIFIQPSVSPSTSLFLLAAAFAVGGVLLLAVDERRGREACVRAEQAAASCSRPLPGDSAHPAR